MESQHKEHQDSSCEERPLPPIPTSGLDSTVISERGLRRRSELPFRYRISSRDITSSRVEEEPILHRLLDSETAPLPSPRFSATSTPLRHSTNSRGALSIDEVDEISYSHMPDYSQHIANSHGHETGVSVSYASLRSRSKTNPITSTYPDEPARSMSRSGNAPFHSHRLPRISSLPVPLNQLDTSEIRDFTLPEWQSDSEASSCPICESQFSFFLRKHHCRMCGRVVCNACSPYRITIPFQYIVQPPSQVETSSSQSMEIQQFGIYNLLENNEGGRQVRICKPCVPDPSNSTTVEATNLNDHFGQNSQSSSSHTAIMMSHESPSNALSYSSREPLDTISHDSSVHSRQPNFMRDLSSDLGTNDPSYRVAHRRLREHGFRPGSLGSRSRGNTTGPLGQPNRVNSSSLPSDIPVFQNHQSSFLSNQCERSLPLPPNSSQPQISEEDECWVCHEELPSRTLENYEILRTDHVNSCVRLAIQFASGPRGDNPISTLEMRNNSEHIHQTSIGNPENLVFGVSPGDRNQETISNLKRKRRTGVFSYKATEKDCIDDAECTICLEEFEAGLEMGRLECFCRFHLKCIREWFKTRPGLCPIHQHGCVF